MGESQGKDAGGTGADQPGMPAADENDTLIAGTAYPETINVDQYEETTVSCDFPAGTLRPGYYDVTVNATFNFETRAYLKTYFMNKEL
jgi:hypothetical protein